MCSYQRCITQADLTYLSAGMGQIIYNIPITDLNHMAMSANDDVEEILNNALNLGLYGADFNYREQ